jgi:hypothetical protein
VSPATPHLERGLRLQALCVIALAVAVLYGPSLRFGFVTDDFYFARPLSAAQLASTLYGNWEPFGQGNAHYRPVIAASFQLDYALWGPRPRGFHLTNLVVMALAGLAGFALLRRLGAGPRGALLAALVWIAHPLSATAASWTSQRTDSIMVVWYLTALVLLLREPFHRRHAVATVVCGLLALGSKEMAASLAPAGALLLWTASPLTALRRRGFAIAILAALTLLYALAWSALFPTKASLTLDGLGTKLPRLLVPVFVPLSYGAAGEMALGWVHLAAVAAAVAAACVGITRLAGGRAARMAGAAAAWPWLTLPPVFGLRDPDVYRLGLLVCFAAPLLAAAAAEAVRLERRAVLAAAAVAALAGAVLAPPAVHTSRAWGPGGFAFTSGNGWKLRDPTWEARLAPEMRRLFRRQARLYLEP